MSEEYKATSRTLVFPKDLDLLDPVRDLAARVEALEADATEQARSQEFCIDFIVQRLEKLEAANDQLSESPAKPLDEAENDRRFEAAKALIDKHDPQRPRVFTAEDALTVAPAGSLVARVLSAMAHAPDGFGYEQEARAAIREVAAWLREGGDYDANAWASLLEQEANPTSQEGYEA